jgi:hypothetical protein
MHQHKMDDMKMPSKPLEKSSKSLPKEWKSGPDRTFTIATKPAGKFLKDGRNAHLIQKPASWWLPLMCSRFEIEFLQKTSIGFILIVKAKNL